MDCQSPSVTVIIASTACTYRKLCLQSALDSVSAQTYKNVSVLLVANGPKVDESLLQELSGKKGINVITSNVGCYPSALLLGRQNINSDYFCFLDDDDLLTPNSIEDRIKEFRLSPYLDLVVGNGERVTENDRIEVIRKEMFSEFDASPVNSLMIPKGNWLASCSGLFKTKSITCDYFEDHAKYAEWSYLAVKLALSRNIKLIANHCYQVNHTENSLSSSDNYLLGLYQYLLKLRQLNTPKRFRKRLQTKITNFEHSLSEHYRSTNKNKAWCYHLRSLSTLDGFVKYIFYSRKLLK